MRKLVLTAIAGSICAVFGSAYADSTVSNNDTIRLAQAAPNPPQSSEKGVITPKSTSETQGPKGDPKPAAARPAPAPAAAPAPAPAMETERAPRRAARKEKG